VVGAAGQNQDITKVGIRHSSTSGSHPSIESAPYSRLLERERTLTYRASLVFKNVDKMVAISGNEDCLPGTTTINSYVIVLAEGDITAKNQNRDHTAIASQA